MMNRIDPHEFPFLTLNAPPVDCEKGLSIFNDRLLGMDCTTPIPPNLSIANCLQLETQIYSKQSLTDQKQLIIQTKIKHELVRGGNVYSIKQMFRRDPTHILVVLHTVLLSLNHGC